MMKYLPVMNESMLMENITEYKVSGRSITAKFCVQPHIPFFNGHFPGDPIMPGVAHIHFVQRLLEHHFCRKTRILSVQKAKFTSPVRPGDVIRMRLIVRGDSVAEWQFQVGKVTVSSGTLVFKTAGGNP